MIGSRMRFEKKSKSSFWKQMKMNSQQPKTYATQLRQSWGKFIAIQDYIKRIETFQTNNLPRCLQELEEQQQRQPRASTRKEITKITADLNDIETKSTILRINKSRSWFFERINKIDKHLIRLIRKEKHPKR